MSKMILIEEAKLTSVLEALESCGAGHISDGGNQWYDEKQVDKAITALREALAQQPAQPASETDMKVYKAIADNYHASLQPTQRKPLTKDQIAKFYAGDSPIVLQIIRDTEAAHGITGEQA